MRSLTAILLTILLIAAFTTYITNICLYSSHGYWCGPFTDWGGNEVSSYTGGQATVTLWDADLNTNAGQVEQATVNVTSTTQVQPETMILTETGISTGIFRGNITFDASSGVGTVDGDLDVHPGDNVVVRYQDAADDWGNPRVCEDDAVYAAATYWGHISSNTTWVVANSPYVISGDLMIDYNTTLTIEPGVEVKFIADYDQQNLGDYSSDSELLVQGRAGSQRYCCRANHLHLNSRDAAVGRLGTDTS